MTALAVKSVWLCLAALDDNMYEHLRAHPAPDSDLRAAQVSNKLINSIGICAAILVFLQAIEMSVMRQRL
jgi:hypothetical protein